MWIRKYERKAVFRIRTKVVRFQWLKAISAWSGISINLGRCTQKNETTMHLVTPSSVTT